MYRPRSTDVWYNAPGVVAAYQPVAAPDSLAARENVGANLRMAGRYMAQIGTAPTHDPRTGWTFSGINSQFLTTGIVVGTARGWSMLVRFADVPLTANSVFAGAIMIAGGNPRFTLGLEGAEWPRLYGNGGYLGTGTQAAAAVMGMAGIAAYWNGSQESGSISSVAGDISTPIDIGRRRRSDGAHDQYYTGKILAILIGAHTLSPAEMLLASRQMAYCHVNPDWSAWGRRRRYYYAPSAAGFLAAWAAHSNSQIGTGASL